MVIEAVTWHGKYNSPGEWPSWFSEAVETGTLLPLEDGALRIKTLEGDMLGSKEDKIIKGVAGEIYACKAGIFNATYEAVACREP